MPRRTVTREPGVRVLVGLFRLGDRLREDLIQLRTVANKATFLVPLADTLPDMEWFKKTYGNKFKVCA